jgi:hypothetical protein
MKFDSLNIVEQLDFINEELQNGKTLQKICDKIGVSIGDDESHALVISDNLKSNLANLAENYEEITQMLEWFRCDDNHHTNVIEVVERGIKIELPKETVPDFRTTIRANDIVWSDFKKFCDTHKEFTQKDLLSQALVEFMNKHK